MTIQSIEQALGTNYSMFYHPDWPAQNLKPVCTLEQSISDVNGMLQNSGRDLSRWSAKDQDEIARLLRANWIWQRLPIEPIRKPILVHLEHNEFVVDCGDTRLMALSLLSHDSRVSVVCTVSKDLDSRFEGWTQIKNNQDLISATGFSASAGILLTLSDSKDYAVSWLEIGDHTTTHHLHDVDLRLQMMQGYLDQQPSNFLFSLDWCKNQIDWNSYAS